ncbi:MAG: ComEC/Rec2 family competence protein [Collinsella intestinalis]
MGVLIGCITATGWLLRWQAGSRAVLGAGGGACVLLIRGDPSAGERGFSSTALMVDVDTGKRLGPVRVLSDAKLENGSSVRAVCRVKALDDSDYARSRFAKGEVASARIVSILKQGTEARGVSIGSLRARALRVLDAGGSDYRALVAGTVCGRTTELNQSEAQADFSACGLTHLVAVSGSHFAYIAAMLERALRHVGLSKGAQQLVMLLVMATYMVFTGGAPSAIRSVCMVAIASAAIMGHRRAHAPSGLAIAVAALVAVDPGAVYDLGSAFGCECCSLSCSAAMSGTIYALCMSPRPLRTPCPYVGGPMGHVAADLAGVRRGVARFAAGEPACRPGHERPARDRTAWHGGGNYI